MTDKAPKTRSHEHVIEINAPVDVVWKAISEAEHITCWLAEKARVTPGEGGEHWVSWGEGPEEGGSKIEVWEPGKRLRCVDPPSKFGIGSGEATDSTQQTLVAEEYTLESRGDVTVLRFVHSGIPNSPDWDGFYDGTKHGWPMFFRALRHYIEKHWGKPRKNLMIMHPIQMTREEGWQKLTGPQGLTATGSLADLKEGDSYSVVTAWGERLNGEILNINPGRIVVMTIEPLDNALLTASVEQMKDQTLLYLTLATFGWSDDRFEALRKQWTKWLDGLYSLS